jgi:hypothetical protein
MYYNIIIIIMTIYDSYGRHVQYTSRKTHETFIRRTIRYRIESY